MTSKIKLLKSRLGDLKDYSNTKWKYSINFDKKTYEWTRDGILITEFQTHPDIDDVHKYQDRLGQCYCETPIHYHHLVQHNETKKFYFVGSHCIHQFNKDGGTGLKRTCIDCRKPNRCHTLRCKSCRIKCLIHDEYHDDNSVCYRCNICMLDHSDSIVHYQCVSCYVYADIKLDMNRCFRCFPHYKKLIKQQMAKEPSFKSKYKRIYDMFIDSRYMNFLNEQEWFQKRYEYNLYQTYLELKAIRQSDK